MKRGGGKPGVLALFRVMDDLTVKLTDHALSRDLFPQDYECLATEGFNESRPLKFMAIESINDRRFSTASDVVSLILVLSTPSIPFN